MKRLAKSVSPHAWMYVIRTTAPGLKLSMTTEFHNENRMALLTKNIPTIVTRATMPAVSFLSIGVMRL